jgi:hypothetical protein
MSGLENEDELAAVRSDAGDSANVLTAAEGRRGVKIAPAGSEHIGDAIDHQGHGTPAHVDQDPLRSPGARSRGETEARAELDHRNDIPAVLGDPGHRSGSAGELDHLERIRDLTHARDRQRVMNVADEKADEVLQRIVTLGFVLHVQLSRIGRKSRRIKSAPAATPDGRPIPKI